MILYECSSPLYSVILYPLKKLFSIILIACPILLMISLAIILTKKVINPDDKKTSKMLINSVYALLIVFAIPVVVNATMYMTNDKFVVSKCWNNAKKVSYTTKYMDVYEEDNNKQINSSYNYTNGKDNTSSSSSANSSKTTSGNVNSTNSTSDLNESTKGSKVYVASASSNGSQAVKYKKWSYKKNDTTKDWEFVVRAKDSSVALKIGEEAKKGSKKSNIKYSASTKGYTLPKELKRVGWDMSKVNKTVYTSCTPYAMACVLCAGIGRDKSDYYKWAWAGSYGLVKKLKSTGKFTVLTDKKIRTKGIGLKVGDILIAKDHGVIVTDVG